MSKAVLDVGDIFFVPYEGNEVGTDNVVRLGKVLSASSSPSVEACIVAVFIMFDEYKPLAIPDAVVKSLDRTNKKLVIFLLSTRVEKEDAEWEEMVNKLKPRTATVEHIRIEPKTTNEKLVEWILARATTHSK